MKKSILSLVMFAALAANAGLWKGLDEKNWYSGPKLTEESLAGKVVIVDKWGVHCPPCRALLPKMQQVWDSFKNKNLVLIGSHCQGRKEAEVAALVKQNKLTFPIYDWAGLAEGEPQARGIPFLYVVNHRGKVVYSGHDSNQALQAAQEAIMMMNLPPSLLGGVTIDKRSPYKSLERTLVLGRPTESIIKRLENDVKKADKRVASAKVKENAALAKQILEAIEEAKREIPVEIEAKKLSNPPEALDLLEKYCKSFPKDTAELKKQIPEMRKAAAEWKKQNPRKRK